MALTRAEGRSLLRGAGKIIAAPYRLVERRSHTVGLPPGSMVQHPDAEQEDQKPARIDVIRYDDNSIEEYTDVDAAKARELTDTSPTDVTWIDVTGVHDVETVAAIGETFGLHPLVQEDLSHTIQRPKLEVYDEKTFIVLRMVRPLIDAAEDVYERGQAGHDIEQISFILGDGFLISFQEQEGDVFDPVRERIRQHAGSIRALSADYLLYALLDVIVDHYFITLERIGDATEFFEEIVFEDPKPEVQQSLSALRRQVVILRRAIWPLRDVLTSLLRDEIPSLSEKTKLYIRDAHDHLIQAVDVLETLRDVLSGLADLYLSAVSYRMNEVMKVLTVVGTLFIPLSFLTGLYGMNFDNIPELHYQNGYFILLGIMAAVTVGALAYFRRKRWF